MARKRANLTDLLNNLTFRTLYNKYKMLACSAYEYDELPEGIEGRHIEKFLYLHGKAIFFKDPKHSYMCLEAQDVGKVNIVGDPIGYRAIGFNYNEYYKAEDCVIIENNELRLNTDDFIMFYINKLAEAERTMDVNIKRVKTPYIIACDDKDVFTFKQIFAQIDGNVPAVFADKNLNLDALNVLKTDAKFLCNELMDYKKSVENELLTFLGYNNLAVDKKERVNVPEAESNNEITKSFAELQLEARQKAVDAINKKYGLSITVKRREVESDVEQYKDDSGAEGDN